MCDTIILGNLDGTVETITAPKSKSETRGTNRTGGDRPGAAK